MGSFLGIQMAFLLASMCGCTPCESSCDPEPVGPDGRVCEQVYVGQGNPYEHGPLTTRRIEVGRCEHAAPRELLIFAPGQAGSYPVAVFQHGFMSRNVLYSQVLEQVASHGFVVVAPQMYEPGLAALFGHPTAAQEAEVAAEIIEWLPGHLDLLIGFHACTDRLGIGGHSRGGKVAWLLMVADSDYARAIAGVDPVDGTGGPLGGQARAIDGPFAFSAPALVIGTGLAGSCAPPGDNHEQFYQASTSPAWHVVVPGQGHADMLDDDGPGVEQARQLCPGGPDTAGMRRLAAGLLVALFRASLQDDVSAYSYLTDASSAPIPITVESK